MRQWSLHPSLLDSKGLVALWREALLAQKVLQGKTKGYRQHPQLQRFRECGEPLVAVSAYLWAVHDEATLRGYTFDESRIEGKRRPISIQVTRGQLVFEWAHLKAKLRQRDPERLQELCGRRRNKPHPLFTVVSGAVEKWEPGR